MGASGATIVSQALGTLTSRIAFLLTFLRLDLEPRVATNLHGLALLETVRETVITYQTVATPYLREVRTY